MLKHHKVMPSNLLQSRLLLPTRHSLKGIHNKFPQQQQQQYPQQVPQQQQQQQYPQQVPQQQQPIMMQPYPVYSAPPVLQQPSTIVIQSPTVVIPPSRPNSYLGLSIFVTLCCCFPFGIVAMIYACQVDSEWESGNHEEARNSAKNAKCWSTSSLIFGMLTSIGICTYYIVMISVIWPRSTYYG